MCQLMTLMTFKQQVYLIVVVLVFLTITLGSLLMSYGGNTILSSVGIIINLSVTGILFYGVKTEDTTHVFVWLIFSLVEMIALVIAMSYYAVKAAHMQNIYSQLSESPSVARQDLIKTIWEKHISFVVFSIIFGLSTIFLFSMIFIVRIFYRRIQRRQGHQPQLR